MLPDVLSAALRALSFVALFQAAGAAIFVATFRKDLGDSLHAIRRIAQFAGVAALAFVLLHLALEAGRMAGSLGGVLDPALQKRVLTSSVGTVAALRVAGLTLLLVGVRGRNGFAWVLAVTGANLALFSFALIGHTAVDSARWMLAPLLLAHVFIVAFWFGALLPLRAVAKHDPYVSAGEVVDRFSRIAFWLVPGILIAGTILSVALVPDLTVLRQPYGTLLLAKVAGFTVLMALAAWNKWRLGPAIKRGDGLAIARFKRVVAFEYALISGVLAITAVLTSFFSPE